MILAKDQQDAVENLVAPDAQQGLPFMIYLWLIEYTLLMPIQFLKIKWRSFGPFSHFLMTFLVLTPSAFFDFQILPDGYVLITSQFFKTSILEHTPYPFSQYGPLWSGFLGLLGFLFNSNWLLLAIRFTSIICYGVAIAFAVKILTLITKQPVSPLFSVLFASSWYYFEPSHGWPSTFILPLSLIAAFIVIKYSLEIRNSSFDALLLGFLIAIIQFTRLQVGVFLLVLYIFILFFFKRIHFGCLVLLGYLITIISVIGVLSSLRFFSDAFFDQVIMAANFHLNPERGSLRIPIWTIIIALIFTLFFIVFSRQISTSTLIIYSFVGVLTLFSIIVLIHTVSPGEEFYFIRWRILQRLYVGFILGLLVYSVIVSGILQIKSDSHKKTRMLRYAPNFFLTATSAAVYSQNYPLFSGHHSWYASLPIWVTSYLFLNEKKHVLKRTLQTKLMLIIIIFSLVLPSGWALNKSRKSFHASINQTVWVNRTQENAFQELTSFANTHIPLNSSLHNFCYEPFIFVVRPDIKPASRIFLWWERFEQFPNYRTLAMQKSDYALVCSRSASQVNWLVEQSGWSIKATSKKLGMVLYESKQ